MEMREGGKEERVTKGGSFRSRGAEKGMRISSGHNCLKHILTNEILVMNWLVLVPG